MMLTYYSQQFSLLGAQRSDGPQFSYLTHNPRTANCDA
mgnify:CR=1 FL=1